MAEILFDRVTRRYGEAVALDDVTLRAADRGFTVLTGPPGSGKSTLLRMLVGLESPDAGAIVLGGVDVTDARPAERPIGYVPQSFALFPHLSVRDNIAYPLRLARAPADRIARAVDRVAQTLSIEPLLSRRPDQLSGGEKQRVAVARGLAREARVFVLDDPLVGLDYKLRERLMSDLKALRAEFDATFLYATSDPLEALTMAQELVVLDAGRVVQHGPVDEVYARPRAEAAMRLVGFPRANLVPGRMQGGEVVAGPLRLRVDAPGAGPVTVGLRPEAISPGPGEVAFAAEVTLVEDLGGEFVIHLDARGAALTMIADADAAARPDLGARLALSARARDCVLFDAAGAAIGAGAG